MVASPLGAGDEEEWGKVSIPFIAGQWSLPAPGAAPGRADGGFNPLHCGAVVASRGTAPTARRSRARFNPLHCGAVVASTLVWVGPRAGEGRFQSPSLRGSGRFIWVPHRRMAGGEGFNPLHCGAVVASAGSARTEKVRYLVSIPFIAGQWSLLASAGEGRWP